jgi:hypothetical protein
MPALPDGVSQQRSVVCVISVRRCICLMNLLIHSKDGCLLPGERFVDHKVAATAVIRIPLQSQSLQD